jgi:hypothetical protein
MGAKKAAAVKLPFSQTNRVKELLKMCYINKSEQGKKLTMNLPIQSNNNESETQNKPRITSNSVCLNQKNNPAKVKTPNEPDDLLHALHSNFINSTASNKQHLNQQHVGNKLLPIVPTKAELKLRLSESEGKSFSTDTLKYVGLNSCIGITLGGNDGVSGYHLVLPTTKAAFYKGYNEIKKLHAKYLEDKDKGHSFHMSVNKAESLEDTLDRHIDNLEHIPGPDDTASAEDYEKYNKMLEDFGDYAGMLKEILQYSKDHINDWDESLDSHYEPDKDEKPVPVNLTNVKYLGNSKIKKPNE